MDHAARRRHESHLGEKGRGKPLHGAARKAKIADDQILANGQVREKVELLVDDADAEQLRVAWSANIHGLAIDLDFGGVRGDDASQDTRQRAFPGAVLADEGVYL